MPVVIDSESDFDFSLAWLTSLNDPLHHVRVAVGLLKLSGCDPHLSVCRDALSGFVQDLTSIFITLKSSQSQPELVCEKRKVEPLFLFRRKFWESSFIQSKVTLEEIREAFNWETQKVLQCNAGRITNVKGTKKKLVSHKKLNRNFKLKILSTISFNKKAHWEKNILTVHTFLNVWTLAHIA